MIGHQVQQCKDHMSMPKKDGTSKDEGAMKMEKLCADMMKGESAIKKDNMNKDMPASSAK